MRIGIDASRAFVEHPTGTERYAFEVITKMLRLPEARKHEWILYTRKITPSLIPPLNLRGGKGVIIKEISFRYLWTQVGLAYRTWVDRLDVLWVPAHTLPVLRKPGIRTIVTIHGIEYEWLPAYENRLQRWYLPLSTQYAVSSADTIIAVSKFTKEQLAERLGADERKIRVIYEGFEITPSSIPPLNLRGGREGDILMKWGLLPKKYLLFVGTVQPRKNLEKLIEAFSRMTSREYKLVICGKLGWMYENVLAAPKYYKIEDRVIFTNYIDDQARQILLDNALVYVQSSITEGFGLPVLEAMAAGVPVVSSNGGALKEVIGDAGILFDPLDVKQLSNSLELVTNSYVLRKQLIERGQKRVKLFGWEKAAKETMNLITMNA